MSKLTLLFILMIFYSNAAKYKYTFAQEWPGSICRHNSCTQANIKNYSGQSFSIHGLWPEIDTEQGSCNRIEECRQEAYNPNSLSSSTIQAMDQSWVGFYSQTDGFRSHEWTKHGTCWNSGSLSFLSYPSQEQYFEKVLSLHLKIDLFGNFKSNGINPTDSNSYSLNQIQNGVKAALNKAFGTYPNNNQFTLLCFQGMLEQVYICFDESYNPTECDCGTSFTNDACPSQVKFPSFRL